MRAILGPLMLSCLFAPGLARAAQQPPRPPAAGPQSPAPSTAAVSPTAPEAAPTEQKLGLPIYPGAQFIRSYDAGRGQRYYLFGVAASFEEVVAYYRTALKLRGDIVFERPATYMFEVGRYRAESMAFPPGVTVKDFTWGGSEGYPNPSRTGQPARFPTVVQIVPATPF